MNHSLALAPRSVPVQAVVDELLVAVPFIRHFNPLDLIAVWTVDVRERHSKALRRPPEHLADLDNGIIVLAIVDEAKLFGLQLKRLQMLDPPVVEVFHHGGPAAAIVDRRLWKLMAVE